MARSKGSPADRFHRLYKTNPHTGCWEWTGSLDRYGYGCISIGSRKLGAHRVSFLIHKGPIPIGLVLDHKCRNRRCVNPAHLQAVTNAYNILTGESFSAVNARKTECVHGHPFDDHNTYRHGRRRSCRACNLAAVMKYKRKLVSLKLKEAA